MTWPESGQQRKTSHEFLLLIADLYTSKRRPKRRSGWQRLALCRAPGTIRFADDHFKTRLDEELRKYRPESPMGKTLASASIQWASQKIAQENGRNENR